MKTTIRLLNYLQTKCIRRQYAKLTVQQTANRLIEYTDNMDPFWNMVALGMEPQFIFHALTKSKI